MLLMFCCVSSVFAQSDGFDDFFIRQGMSSWSAKVHAGDPDYRSFNLEAQTERWDYLRRSDTGFSDYEMRTLVFKQDKLVAMYTTPFFRVEVRRPRRICDKLDDFFVDKYMSTTSASVHVGEPHYRSFDRVEGWERWEYFCRSRNNISSFESVILYFKNDRVVAMECTPIENLYSPYMRSPSLSLDVLR